MADVQLEHGYTRLANRLLEAIIEARFSERQMNVLLVLLRLTYGWRRRSVQLTELQLAEWAGVVGADAKRAGGAFRADLYELIREGVVVRIDAASDKRGMMSWGINKDFGNWGRFSIAAARLAARWDPKPTTTRVDEVAIQEEMSGRKPSAPEIDSRPDFRPDNEPEWPESGPSYEEKWPDPGPDSGPTPGHSVARHRATFPTQVDDSQSLTPPERHRKKEKEITTTATADAADDRSREPDNGVLPETAYAIGLTTAANAAITARWSEQPAPLHFASASQLAVDLIDMGVDLEVARSGIAAAIKISKLERPPRAMEYFRGIIVDAHRAAEQRALNGQDRSNGERRGGTPVRIAAVISADVAHEQAALEREYDAARKAAGIAWGKDPKNADAYRAIVAAANAQFADLLKLEKSWGVLGRDTEVVLRCAEAAGFPSFDVWAREHTMPEHQEAL